MTVLVLTLAFLLALGGTAFAQFSSDPGVTITPGGENCNGIIPTPGSENTVKTLVGGTLVPGGTAIYQISYPVDASHIDDEWEIVDCVLIGTGTNLKNYAVLDQATFSGVINSTAFVLNFTFSIPADALVGQRICNVAKTTQGPSAPQSSNRKAGPACFTIGGDARVEKHSTTDPDGPPIGGATFVVDNCVNAADDPAIQPLFVNGISILPGPGTLTILSATGVISFTGAVGSHCDVTETIPPPGYSLPPVVTQVVTITSASTVHVYRFFDPPAPGSLQISKVAPVGSSQTFTFDIVCTNPSNSYTLTITGTGTATQTGIPAGSVCTVTEVVPAGFNPPVYSPSQTVTIVSAQTVTITVTNSLAPGALTINKVAPAGSTQTFTFDIACTNPVNAYQLQITGSGTATQSGIPAGSVCTVTEVVPAGFAQPVFSPVGPYTIGPAQTITVLVTNSLLPGNLTINKVAPAGSTQTFSFTVTCTNPNNSYPATITGSGSATISGIPAGSVCTVAETVPAGFATPVYSPSDTVTIGPDSTVSVTVTNALLPGALIINKVAPAEAQDVEYVFDVICLKGETSTVYGAIITGTDSATISGITAGSVCTVTEIAIGQGFAPPTYSPPGGTVTVPGGAAAAVQVTVTNSLLPLGIQVVKTALPISGSPGQAVTYTYVVTNTGQVTLFDVSVDDDILGHVGDIAELAPGESKTLTFDTTLPAAAGLLTNVATVVGTDEFGRTASDTDDATVTVILGTITRRPLPTTGAAVGGIAVVGLLVSTLGALMLLVGRRRPVDPVAAGVGGIPAAQWIEERRIGFSRWRRTPGRWRGPGNRAGP